MQARAIHTLSLILCLLIAASGLAQEGHPLVGSWHGDWGTNAKSRTDITVIMDWDGKVISGVVNPGFEGMALQNAKLNPKDWTVHFEVDMKEKSGNTVRCIADGKIDKLGSDRRTLAGSWNCGTTKGDFKLTRDRDY
jgi:hypothetical protein